MMEKQKLEDIARRIVDHGLLICRGVDDGPNTLKRGNVSCECQWCGRPVQVSADGQAQLLHRGPMVIARNPCGLLIASLDADTEIQFGPDALRFFRGLQ